MYRKLYMFSQYMVQALSLQSGSSSSYDVIVQYSSAYLTHTDEKHTVTCSDGGDVGLVGAVVNSGGLDGV